MNSHTRRAVAYIAARTISEKEASAVYDYAVGRYFNFSGDFSKSSISVYDYEQKCHISGDGRDKVSLYHYGNKKYLTIEFKSNEFTGYDYDSQKYFSGTINGSSVSVYDYEQSKYFNYSV